MTKIICLILLALFTSACATGAIATKAKGDDGATCEAKFTTFGLKVAEADLSACRGGINSKGVETDPALVAALTMVGDIVKVLLTKVVVPAVAPALAPVVAPVTP